MKIGFIGTGNMGSSIIKGLVFSKFINRNDINIFDINEESLKILINKYEVNEKKSEIELVEDSDIIVLSVKPHIVFSVLEKIKEKITKNKIVLSIAAGISIENIEDIIGKDKKIVRTMPNTPAQILEGMTGVSFNKNIEKSEKELIFSILNSFGKCIEIEEKQMHVYTAISGSLPAYVYLFIEALADGGVLEGMDRKKAYNIISQSVIGAAKMVLETGKHPGQLKDEVTSPSGTTIEALKVLESNNFRGTLMETVKICTQKSKSITK